jgi:hypothetical protein
MPIAAQAKQAITTLDKTVFDGNIITVSELPSALLMQEQFLEFRRRSTKWDSNEQKTYRY